MTHGRSSRMVWTGVALLAGLVVPASAGAVIPHEALITPGELRGIAHMPGDPWVYGYWEYLPQDFELGVTGPLPLLVFLPGIGEYDDVSSCPGGTDVCTADACGSDGLCRNLTWGPQLLMRNDEWDDVLRPFIMVSPQHPVPPISTTPWNLDQLDDFLQFVVDEYPIDERRMYLIGMSQGGRAVLQYTQAYPRRFTAVAPTPGGTVDPDASCYFQDTALWVFHGENDADGNLGPGVFAPCNMVGVAYQYDNPDLYAAYPQCAAIVGEPRPPGRLTMYYDVAHSSWIQTVDPIGSGFPTSEWTVDQGCGLPATFREYTAALDPDGVYSWFLSLDRPRVEAPPDAMVDQTEISLLATITDDDPVTIEWTQTDGPPATLSNADTDTLDVADLMPSEQYTFQVYVLDADDQWDLDEVVITTDEMLSGGSSSGGASSSTGDADSTGGVVGSTGAVDSTGGGSGSADTTEPGSTGAGGESPDDTADPPADGSGGQATGEGTGTDDGAPAGDDDGASGCGCRSDDRPGPGGWAAWAVVLLAIRRRRARGQG